MNNEVSIAFGKLKDGFDIDEINGYTSSIAQRGYLLCDKYRDFIIFDGGSAEAADYLSKLCMTLPEIRDETEKKDAYSKVAALAMVIMDAVRIELLEPSDYFTVGHSDFLSTITEDAVQTDDSEMPF